MLRRFGVLVCVLGALAGPSAAGDRQVPDNAGQMQMSFAPIVKRVAPAVVNVYATRMIRQSASPLFADPFFRQLFGDPFSGTTRERRQSSLGSGVIINAAGLIVTNFHVIAEADEVKVALSDKREFPADIILRDQRSDLAVLRIKGATGGFPTLQFADSDSVQVGDLVLAIGDPVRRRPDGHQRHRIGVRPAARRPVAGSVLHPDRRGDQSWQFRRCAGRHERQSHRHQLHHRLAGRRVERHRLRHPVQSRPCRHRAGSDRRGAAPPWLGADLQSVTPDIAATIPGNPPPASSSSRSIPPVPALPPG